MPDEYDSAKLIVTKEFKSAKLLEQEKPWSSKVKLRGDFNGPKQVFGEDVLIPHKLAAVEREPGVVHDAAFKPPLKPSRSGYNCTLSKFPEYMEAPPLQKTRKPTVEGEEVPPPFKLTYKYRSRPSSSVVCNKRNLRTAYPSVFCK